METQDLTGLRRCTMMAVMKQRFEAELSLQSEDGVDHKGIVPFVQQDNVDALEFRFRKMWKIFR